MMIAVVITSTSVCLFTAIALLAIRLADSRTQARQDKTNLVVAIANYEKAVGR